LATLRTTEARAALAEAEAEAEEFLDRAGVAEYMDVAVKSVDKMRERSDAGTGPPFPEPAHVWGRTPVWRLRDIAAFNTEYRTQPGRR
jgi:hypothetical protein